MPKFEEHRTGSVNPHTEEHDVLHEIRDLLEAIYESVRQPGSSPWSENKNPDAARGSYVFED